MAAITPELSDDDGTISPSHGSSAFDNKSDEKINTLVTRVQSQLPGANGSWSVYICDLSGGSEATINDSPMQAASLIKLFIMGAVYENYDSLSQQYGSATLDSYLTPMITVSDNDAANSLVSCLGSGDSTAGMQKVNSFCQSHGYTNTSMGRLLLASNEFGDNYTSAYDCGKFLKEIYQICSGTTQTPSLLHAEEMYSLLKQQQRTNKIPAALPEGVSVANKTGELSDVENDAGILYNAQGGNDLVIVFLSQNLSSPGEAQNTIAQLSRSIYLYYND
ncbi:MAG: serine hydrolase [Ruminococcus sp.]